MKASIIIPTFGTRPDYLTDVLETAKKQNYPNNAYEILVVDNTPESKVLSIVEKVNNTMKGGPLVRHIKESEIGLHMARHTGAYNAKGNIVIYIGDDVLLNPDWLSAILEPFSDPHVGCSGGKLIAQWDAPKPEWLSELKHMALGMLDLGDETKVLSGELVWGDNMAIRKSVLFEVGGFHPDNFGDRDKGLAWFRGDGECGLETKIYKRGYKIVYEPRAWVFHRVPASRVTKEYFYKRSFTAAIGSSYSQIRNMQSVRFLPVRLWLQSAFYFLKASVLFLKSQFFGNKGIGIRTRAFHYYGKANHQLRASFSKKLRNHIFQASYLT